MANTLMMSGGQARKNPTMKDLTADQKKLYNAFIRIGASKQSAMIEAMGSKDPLKHKIFDLM